MTAELGQYGLQAVKDTALLYVWLGLVSAGTLSLLGGLYLLRRESRDKLRDVSKTPLGYKDR